jgi:uncharacterized protein YndB with AHSA1/START domain
MIVLFAALSLQAVEPAELQRFDVEGYRTRIEVEIAAPRDTVFDAATGDVSPWWDHTFYPDPAELVIEAELGGRFYERFVAGEPDGVIHADIISVYRPELLRLDGPLGLSGRAYQMVTTWTLEEASDGAETRFIIDLAMMGEVDAELAGIVRGVWVHFIEGRLKPYVEAGCHTAPEEPCAVFANDG